MKPIRLIGRITVDAVPNRKLYRVVMPAGATDLKTKVTEVVKKIDELYEQKVPQYGNFPHFELTFDNPDAASIVKKIKITIRPSTDPNKVDIRMLKAEMFSNRDNMHRSLARVGTKEELYKYIKSNEFLPDIETAVKKAEEQIPEASKRPYM